MKKSAIYTIYKTLKQQHLQREWHHIEENCAKYPTTIQPENIVEVLLLYKVYANIVTTKEVLENTSFICCYENTGYVVVKKISKYYRIDSLYTITYLKESDFYAQYPGYYIQIEHVGRDVVPSTYLSLTRYLKQEIFHNLSFLSAMVGMNMALLGLLIAIKKSYSFYNRVPLLRYFFLDCLALLVVIFLKILLIKRIWLQEKCRKESNKYRALYQLERTIYTILTIMIPICICTGMYWYTNEIKLLYMVILGYSICLLVACIQTGYRKVQWQEAFCNYKKDVYVKEQEQIGIDEKIIKIQYQNITILNAEGKLLVSHHTHSFKKRMHLVGEQELLKQYVLLLHAHRGKRKGKVLINDCEMETWKKTALIKRIQFVTTNPVTQPISLVSYVKEQGIHEEETFSYLLTMVGQGMLWENRNVKLSLFTKEQQQLVYLLVIVMKQPDVLVLQEACSLLSIMLFTKVLLVIDRYLPDSFVFVITNKERGIPSQYIQKKI